MAKRVLKGMTWDHPRGFDPLARGAPRFAAEHPDIEVTWTRRSLRDFGVQPVEVLAESYDLIVVDHPFCGRAQATGCLVDLKPHLDPDFLDILARESVGPSTRSYHFGGGIWALPTDAACQVASYRPDLIADLGYDGAPRNYAEVIELAKAARSAGKWIALPAVQSDAACLIASLSANLGQPIPPDGNLLPDDVFETVLDTLDELIGLAHPESTRRNPIQTYDAMSTGDDIVYVPFGFGYTNYSRRGAAKPIRFTTVAGPGPDPAAGAILGGAGCAVSSSCRDLDAALTYMRWLHDPAHQAGDYFRFGGQPGLRSAWTSPENDAEAGAFFSGTLETIDKAYLRPRFDGFIHGFEHMGLLISRYLAGDGSRAEVIRSSQDSYSRAAERAKMHH